MKKYYNTIKKHPIFAGYSDKELDTALLGYRAVITKYKKNDVLFIGSEKLSHFGMVLDGSVQVSTNDIDGNRMIMAMISKGQTFGESICFLKIEDSGIFIEACEECSVLWLNPEGINHEMLKRFTETVAKRTLQMNMRIQTLSKLTIREKLLTFFAEEIKQNGNAFRLSMSREDMAIYLGTNRSALSRELSKMKAEKIIDFHGSHFEILN